MTEEGSQEDTDPELDEVVPYGVYGAEGRCMRGVGRIRDVGYFEHSTHIYRHYLREH